MKSTSIQSLSGWLAKTVLFLMLGICSMPRVYSTGPIPGNGNHFSSPAIASISLAPDNSYVDVVFSEAVYSTIGGTGVMEASNFTLFITGGSAANPIISGLKQADNTDEASASVLAGGESTIRIFFNATGFADGSETLTVNPADASSIFNIAGEAAAASQSNNTVVMNDKLAPGRPSIPKLDPSTDSGVSQADRITNHTVVKFTGTAEANSEVSILSRRQGELTGMVLGMVMADGSGAWEYTTDPLDEGDYTIVATATDAAGNTSEKSFIGGVDIDLSPPMASIQRQYLAEELLSGSYAEFVIQFSETVENVDATDFSLSGPAASGASFSYSKTFFFVLYLYEIKVSNINTEGLLDLDFTENTGITDLAGNVFAEEIIYEDTYTIDNTTPIITDVKASSANGNYGSIDQITIQTTFSESVNVTGSPTLELETGTTDQNATYSSGSGTSTLEFTYTVLSGDASADLDYTNTSALALNGGSIKDAANLGAVLTLPNPGAAGSLGANSDIVVDGSTPNITSVSLAADNSYVDVTFTEGVYSTNGGSGALEVSDFTLSISGGSATAPVVAAVTQNDNASEISASALGGGESTVRVFFSTTGAPDGGEVLTVNPANGSSIFDQGGNGAVASQINNTSTMNDQAGPVISGASIPNSSAKVGDMVIVTITTGETGLSLNSGSLNGVNLTDFVDNNDNTYSATYTVVEGHTNRAAGDDVPISLILSDGNGNLSSLYNTSISQTADLIDAHSPSNSISTPIAIDDVVNGTEDMEVKISGTTIGVENGRVVAVLFDDGANPTVRVQANVVFGGWTTTAADISGLNNGSITVTANVTDFAGNPAPEAQTSVILDNIAPFRSLQPDLDNSTDSGHSNSDHFTNHTELKVIGTAEANSTITVNGSYGLVGVTAADGSGAWSITTATLPEGHQSFSFTAADAAGNVSEKSFPMTASIDLTAPTVSAIDRQSPVSINTKLSSVVFRVYFNTQRVFNVDIGDFEITGTAAGGTASITSVKNIFGNTTYDVTVSNINTDGLLNLGFSTSQDIIDLSGNLFAGVIGLEEPYTMDFTAPVKPAVTHISDDTGSSNSDGVTNDANIVISGTAEALSSVEVFTQYGSVKTTTTDANGDWTLNITDISLVELSFNLTAKATDLAGNESAASDAFVLKPDYTAPAKPVITSITDDTGSSNSDGVTNDANIVISGTAEALSSVEVFTQYGSVRTTTTDANGDWSLDITDISLVELSFNLTAKATDLAGNSSAASDVFVLKPDYTAPDKPVITSITDDTGSSNSDGVTNDANIIISGTAEALSSVEVFTQYGTVRTTEADANGEWALDITDITLLELSFNLTAKATDLAGNTSAASDIFVLKPDYTAPVKPVITSISDDTGSSNSDGVTNDANIIISGTAEALSIIEVFTQYGSVRTTTTDANGDWSLDITDISLVELSFNLTAKATDLAGNSSATSDIFVLKPDYTAPAKPVITSITDDTGSSNSDGITNDANIIISGTGEALSSVEVFTQFGSVRTTTTDANGDWSLDITDISLVELKFNLTAKATDLAGNSSVASDVFVLTADYTSPVVTIDIDNNSAAGYLITALFDENVSGLELSEISVTGGTASDLVQISPSSYSFLINSSGSTADVMINANTAQDLAGNNNTASNQLSLSFTEQSAREGFTNLSNLSKTEAVSIYPNPASSLLTIDLSELSGDSVDIALLDMSGKRVFNVQDFGQNQLKVDVSVYKSGLYLVLISTEESMIKKKVLIRK